MKKISYFFAHYFKYNKSSLPNLLNNVDPNELFNENNLSLIKESPQHFLNKNLNMSSNNFILLLRKHEDFRYLCIKHLIIQNTDETGIFFLNAIGTHKINISMSDIFKIIIEHNQTILRTDTPLVEQLCTLHYEIDFIHLVKQKTIHHNNPGCEILFKEYFLLGGIIEEILILPELFEKAELAINYLINILHEKYYKEEMNETDIMTYSYMFFIDYSSIYDNALLFTKNTQNYDLIEGILKGTHYSTNLLTRAAKTNGDTLLHLICKHNNEKMFKEIVQSVNPKEHRKIFFLNNQFRKTPLDEAVFYNNLSLIKLFPAKYLDTKKLLYAAQVASLKTFLFMVGICGSTGRTSNAANLSIKCRHKFPSCCKVVYQMG